MNVEKISGIQVMALFFVSIMSTLTVLYPTNIAGVNGWISGVLASGYDLLIVGIVYILHKKAPGKSIIQALDKHMVIRYVVAFLFFIFLLTLSAITIADLRELVAEYLLLGTPVTAILGIALLICAIAAKQGLEAIGRLSEWIFPLLLIMITVMTLFLIPDVNTEQLLPILEAGWGPVFNASLQTFDFIGFIFVTLFIMPYVNKSENVHRAILIVVLLIGSSLVLQSFFIIGVLGEPLAKNFAFPIVDLAYYAQLTELFDKGLEAFLLAFWQTTIIIKISLILWVMADIIAKTLNFKDRKPFVFPITFLSGTWSLTMFPNLVTLLEFSKVFTLWAISVQFLLPLLLLPIIYLSNTDAQT